MQQAQKLFRSDNHKVGHKPERLAIRKAGNFVDVFYGPEGFRSDEWARFHVVKVKGQVVPKQIRGGAMPKELFNQFLNKLKEA